jgi:hypothetical protein
MHGKSGYFCLIEDAIVFIIETIIIRSKYASYPKLTPFNLL